jgi:hypothetical protein
MQFLGIGSSDVQTDLIPADPTVSQQLETPAAITKVIIPADRGRTSLLVCSSGPYQWHQIASTVPVRFSGSYRLRWSSAALPPPGSFTFGLGLDTIEEFTPSDREALRSADPSGCFGLERVTTGRIIASIFGVDEATADAIARKFLTSQITLELGVRIRVRAVSEFHMFGGMLSGMGRHDEGWERPPALRRPVARVVSEGRPAARRRTKSGQGSA